MSILPDAITLIEKLSLEKHIEGGYYRQTYKSSVDAKFGDARKPRSLMTSIYYLLTRESAIGHFHKNTSDIMHYYHCGDPIDYFLLLPNGELTTFTLGFDVNKGHTMQMMVPGGVWKASRLHQESHGYGLIGESVVPGFEYEDMVLGQTTELLAEFPHHGDLIIQLSR